MRKRMKENHNDFAFQILPEYYNKHNYLTFCNDVLVSILKYVDLHKLSSQKIDFESPEKFKEFNELPNDENNNNYWQDWLMENGYKEAMYQGYYRHILFSLIADFCNYMLESINCAAKMKIAVSYALLRKPLKDTLGYIEWLYVNKTEVIDLLVNGNAKDLEITKERAKINIDAIKEKDGANGYFDFRYEKHIEYGLEGIWSQANHVITTRHKYASTKNGNLNFIFADEKILQDFSRYYYMIIPNIMSYVISLITSMFEEFAPINQYTKAMNMIIRHLRMAEVSGVISYKEATDPLKDLGLPIICPRCGRKKELIDKEIFRIISGVYKCPRCFKKVNTARYVFDWEKIKIINKEELKND